MNSYIRGKTGLKDVIPVDGLEDEILVRSVNLGGKIHRRKEKSIINEFKGFKIASLTLILTHLTRTVCIIMSLLYH